MKKKLKLKLKTIEGNYKFGVWMHDQDAFTDEDIEFINKAWEELAKETGKDEFRKLIWKPNREDKLKLKRIK